MSHPHQQMFVVRREVFEVQGSRVTACKLSHAEVSLGAVNEAHLYPAAFGAADLPAYTVAALMQMR